MAKSINYKKRLEEIALTKLGVLSDEEVLHLLAERKQMQELQDQYDKREEEREMAWIKKEKAAAQGEIDRLNKLITPDKPDDELIRLVEERKVWEAKMVAVEQNKGEVDVPIVQQEETEVALLQQDEGVSLRETSAQVIEVQQAFTAENTLDEELEQEKVTIVEFDEANEFYPYLEQIRGNNGSIGRILEGLPVSAKRNKPFMLEVAKIDPSYAMHYADPGTLKRDPDFNVRVAAMKNNKGVGSALAEMLPEARTPQVVMAAIKNDYRNVRFLLPQMEGYDDMLTQAKRGALEKVKELKDGAGPSLLFPKILQKDKEFMKQIEAAVSTSRE
jgi:hypothetical protein